MIQRDSADSVGTAEVGSTSRMGPPVPGKPAAMAMASTRVDFPAPLSPTKKRHRVVQAQAVEDLEMADGRKRSGCRTRP
ncbi:hypothetical protein QP028_12815 [Corynebacterium suedekumii]|nr:hypothetical protein QP028_12815 [Corynebacterium suedekumii]